MDSQQKMPPKPSKPAKPVAPPKPSAPPKPAAPPKSSATKDNSAQLAGASSKAKQPVASPKFSAPEKPATPAKPSAPPKPSKPEKPATPAKPSAPTKPSKPEKSLKNEEKVQDAATQNIKPENKTQDSVKKSKRKKDGLQKLNKVQTKNDSRPQNPFLNDLIAAYKDKSLVKINTNARACIKKKYNRVLLVSTKLDKEMFKPVWMFINPNDRKAGIIAGMNRLASSKRKLAALIGCIVALIAIGLAAGLTFILKSKETEWSPYLFKDNVSIEVTELLPQNNTNVLPGAILELTSDFSISVPQNTEEIEYDIVAYAMTLDVYFEDNNESALDYVFFKFSNVSEIYNFLTPSGQDPTFYKISENDKTIYFTDILGIGKTKQLLDAIMISNTITNEQQRRKIIIDYGVYAVYPNEQHLSKEEGSMFLTAPSEWKKIVSDKAAKYQDEAN